ncbi:hypothetical protein OG203_16905 [Nocardia sp. NBC_01499]|uniref:hypothetical protein n=1 Tax=Nocardia sp. NBC_01499 TaxID=2903597 RepID=UPI003868FC86
MSTTAQEMVECPSWVGREGFAGTICGVPIDPDDPGIRPQKRDLQPPSREANAMTTPSMIEVLSALLG